MCTAMSCATFSPDRTHQREHSAAVRPQPKIDAPIDSSQDGSTTYHREEYYGASYRAASRRYCWRLGGQAERISQEHQRPLCYVESAQESKEDMARAIMEKDGIREGLVCGV